MRQMTNLLALLALSALLTAAAGGQSIMVTTDGSTHRGTLEALGPGGAQLRADGQVVKLPAAALAEIQFLAAETAPASKTDGAAIVTRRGDRLALTGVLTLSQGRLGLATALTGPAMMPLEQAELILLPSPGSSAAKAEAQLKALSFSAGAEDVMVVRSDAGELVPVAGALRGIAGGKVTFRYEQSDRTMDLAKVLAIRLAAVGPTTRPAAKPALPGEALSADGTRLVFDAVRLVNGRLELLGTALGDVAVPREAVTTLLLRSENVTYLGDLTPVAIEQAGTFDRAWPHRVNGSTLGGPLQLGGRTYSRGLGLHSRCRLTYALDGQYARFVALAGIDDKSPHGDATLTVLADEKPLLEAVRLAGGEKPVPVRLDVSGAKTLTILVEFGQTLDVGDHVDLADARLLKD